MLRQSRADCKGPSLNSDACSRTASVDLRHVVAGRRGGTSPSATRSGGRRVQHDAIQDHHRRVGGNTESGRPRRWPRRSRCAPRALPSSMPYCCASTMMRCDGFLSSQAGKQRGRQRDVLDHERPGPCGGARGGCDRRASCGLQAQPGALLLAGLPSVTSSVTCTWPQTCLPSLPRMLLKRTAISSDDWSLTKVPRPWRRVSRCSASIMSSALRIVPELTPNSRARSLSLGMAVLGFHSPWRSALPAHRATVGRVAWLKSDL